MKLIDIFCEITLNESGNRLFDYTLIHSEDNGETFVKYFSVDISPKIEVAVRYSNFGKKIVGDVSFYSEKGFDLLNTFNAGQVSSLISTVADICSQFDNIDIWFFCAKFGQHKTSEEFDKRTLFYNKVAMKYSAKTNKKYYRLTYKGSSVFVISNSEISSQFVNDYASFYGM